MREKSMVLLYAFALQMPLGIVADRWNRNALLAAIGCGLAALAYACGNFLLAGILCLGIGNGLFHVGAGTDVLNSWTRKAAPMGLFLLAKG